MKTITLFTLGTETDIHYMLALGVQLQQQGHTVCLSAPLVFQAVAHRAGLAFRPVETEGEIKKRASNIKNQKSRTSLQSIQQLAENSSLMVVHQPYLPLIQVLGPLPCPVMSVALQAEEVFTRFNKKPSLVQRIASWMKRNGGKTCPSYIPALYNFSPQLLQEEQASIAQLSGQWAIPDNLQWKLSGRAPSLTLSDWLHRGGRPVFFDFSEVPETERERLLKMVNTLSQTMGFRAILCTDWAGCEEGPLQRDIFHVKSPVQEWLFQQCAAVIHYRQSDRLPAALRAGIPNIVCASDAVSQKWGAILKQQGIGIHLRQQQPTAAALEAALEQALRLSMQYKAKALGKALREENGLEYTAKVIGQQVEREVVAVAV